MSWKASAEYWRKMPWGSSAIFAMAVFCLFGAIGFTPTSSSVAAPYPIANLTLSIFNGLCASAWAIAGTRRYIKTMIALGCLQMPMNVGLSLLFDRMASAWSSPALNPGAYLSIRGRIAAVLVVLGYALFLGFFRVEAKRYFSAITEVRLSGEIHRSLVPEVDCRQGDFQFYGRSWPSGEVGGDLVDVVADKWGWLVYVADVSGHGIPAGVLMTMMKSAARMRLATAGTDGFLESINQVLLPLSEPHMYATLAYLSWTKGRLQFSTAGHGPILHYRSRSVSIEDITVENLPLALLETQRYEVREVATEPGDLLVILTDGLTEIADTRDRELGVEPLKAAILDRASAPLDAIADELRRIALAHGKQSDDQTLLLMRHSPA